MATIQHNETAIEFKCGDILNLYLLTKIGTGDLDIQTWVVKKDGTSDDFLDDVINIDVPSNVLPSQCWEEMCTDRFLKNNKLIKTTNVIEIYAEGNFGITYTKEELNELLVWFNSRMNTNFTLDTFADIKYIEGLNSLEFTAGMILYLSKEDTDGGYFYETNYDWKTTLWKVGEGVNPIIKGDTLMQYNLIVSDRQFVKIVDEKEIDIAATDLKPGDIFSLYSDREKKTKCYWDDITIFRCYGLVYKNEDDVEFIPCLPVK